MDFSDNGGAMSGGNINICRAITFCSNFIPANTTSAQWEYISIGTIDGIMVSDNLVNPPTVPITQYIWKEQKKFQGKLEGEYTAQQIFVIRYGSLEKEQNFWNLEKEYPFYFFCFCQIMGEKNVLWDNKEKLEEYLEKQADIKVLTYLTYDNTDLFIVMKARAYDNGAQMINRLHQKVNLSLQKEKAAYLKNSYTVFAVNKEWLGKLTEDDIDILNKQRIDSVHINVMEQERQGKDIISYFTGRLDEKMAVPLFPILGENDDIIILRNIGWGRFLKLYREVSGSDGILKNGLAASISTLLVTWQEDCEGMFEDDENQYSNKKEDEKRKGEKYLSKIASLKTKYGVNDNDEYGELKIILNALPKFTGEVFNDYIFYFLLKPIEFILEFIYKYRMNRDYNKEYYYEFINHLYMYIQTSNMSDKHTVQGLGFNSKIYDVPIKLSAFYNAFLYRMTEILNADNQCEYVFLTVPGMQFNVNVNELYPYISKEKRLILIKIPESSFYKICDMMNILGHETAHYVGRRFRNRRKRLFSFVKSYVHIFAGYLYNMYIMYFGENLLTKEMLADIEKRIYDLAILGLEKRRIYIDQNNKDESNIAIDYFVCLIPNLAYVMESLIENDLELALSPIAKGIDDEKQAVQIMDNFREIVDRFMFDGGSRLKMVNSRSVLEMLHSLFEECFADIMSILILGTSMKDYISCMISEAEEQGMPLETFEKTDAMFRIGTVILCLYDLEGSLCSWKEEFDVESTEPWIGLAKKSVLICYSEENIAREDFEDNIYACVANKIIFDNLYSYLKECIVDFTSYKNEPDMQDKIIKIQKVYHTFSEKDSYNAEKQIKVISEVIEDFKDSFWKKL